MKYTVYDLHQCNRGEQIQVTLQGSAANVRLMDSSNYNNYKNGRKHRYYGGLIKMSPIVLTIPNSGHWYITIDLAGLIGTVRSSIRKLPAPLPEYREPALSSVPSLVRKNVPPTFGSEDSQLEYDVFISHASEDKEDVVRPPAQALVTKGLKGEKIVNVSELISLGAIAFSDDGKPIENMHLLREALKYINSHDSIIISHSEDSSLANSGVINEGKISTRLGLKGIPSITESLAIARELEIVRATKGRYHFAHISTKRSVELIRQAKKEGLNVTCETAPHYFSLSEDDIKDYDAKYKVNPPLRTKEDIEAIIDGLIDSTIDVIATDHAPHTVQEKLQPIQNAPMGLAGFETALSVALNYLVHSKKMPLIEVIRKFTSNPAKILNLKDQGDIQAGKPANLTVIDLNEERIVDASKFKSKCRISPFDKLELKGTVKNTIIKGKIYNIG